MACDQEFVLAASTPAASKSSATSRRFLPGRDGHRHQLVGGALDQDLQDLLGGGGRDDDVPAGLETPGDAALPRVQAEHGGPIDQPGGVQDLRRPGRRWPPWGSPPRRVPARGPDGCVAIAPGCQTNHATAASPRAVVIRKTASARVSCRASWRSSPARRVALAVQPALQDDARRPPDRRPACGGARDRSAASSTSSASTVVKLSSIRFDGHGQHRRAAARRTPGAARGRSPARPCGSSGRPSTTRLGVELAHHRGDGVQIALAAMAGDGGVRLRGQTQTVGDRDAHAPRPQIDGHNPSRTSWRRLYPQPRARPKDASRIVHDRCLTAGMAEPTKYPTRPPRACPRSRSTSTRHRPGRLLEPGPAEPQRQ